MRQRRRRWTDGGAEEKVGRVKVGLVLAAAIIAAPASGDELQIRVQGERVEIQASAAHLADILDELARRTAMKVIYDGTSPRPLISVRLEA